MAALLRMKVLDAASTAGPLRAVDRRHRPDLLPAAALSHCLVQRHDQKTLYLHQVLEAKLLGPGGMVVSLGSEFIENADATTPNQKC